MESLLQHTPPTLRLHELPTYVTNLLLAQHRQSWAELSQNNNNKITLPQAQS